MENCLSLGMTAPEFTANSTFGEIKLSDYKGKWIVLFSHPGDFTPVCTTEFLAFSRANKQFQERNVQLIGLSIDSNPSHLAWVNSIEEISGIRIPFPIIADRIGDIARLYGMVAPDVNTQSTIRDVFIIDPNQEIRAILSYPIANGRNITEILRLVIAIQTSDVEKSVTPANWRPGTPTLAPPPQTYEQLLERKNNPEELELTCNDWYWCYKEEK